MTTSNIELASDLRKAIRGVVKADEPMSKHTTFKIGGPADVFVDPADADDLAAVVSWANRHDVPWLAFGAGANMLVSDRGIRGILIKMGRPFQRIELEGERLYVGSGANLDKVVSVTTEAGLAGLEYAAAIPGTVGGAIVMNAGTYRGQIGDVIETVSVVTSEGERRDLSPEDSQFRYRWSVFQVDRSRIIVSAIMRLRPGDRDELVRTAEGIRRKRATNLPSGPSAGCVFKNPEGQSAGQLIDQAGLKGTRVGDAVVADKHGNFIVNEGKATASDVKALADLVRQAIREKFGVELEFEVRIVGDW
ncbi:MAG: UDP-N-acetylmuramate dehydrogenase [Armatimonadetes bacterium]|nr:UDP-N-acetylmuramate dehydrogenase [Armatimonadota bacterium]